MRTGHTVSAITRAASRRRLQAGSLGTGKKEKGRQGVTRVPDGSTFTRKEYLLLKLAGVGGSRGDLSSRSWQGIGCPEGLLTDRASDVGRFGGKEPPEPVTL